ncbi:MAG: hypothetical protein IID14_05770 [Candidatus Marinimicrobia bacterium]|nr:hypothetical protein [Candidatus Neomarinimicrobiota bacterium]
MAVAVTGAAGITVAAGAGSWDHARAGQVEPQSDPNQTIKTPKVLT